MDLRTWDDLFWRSSKKSSRKPPLQKRRETHSKQRTETTVIGDYSRWIWKRPQSRCPCAWRARSKLDWKRTEELNKNCGSYQENMDTLFRPNIGSGATSRSGLDVEEIEFNVESGVSMRMISSVDLTLEEQEGHVRYCPTLQGFFCPFISWKLCEEHGGIRLNGPIVAKRITKDEVVYVSAHGKFGFGDRVR